jgi:hypothetical protein
MDRLADRRKWWRDFLARLVITVVGGVTAALIVAVLIPRLLDDGNASDAPTQQEAPAEGSDGGQAPSETAPPEEAPAVETTAPSAEGE